MGEGTIYMLGVVSAYVICLIMMADVKKRQRTLADEIIFSSLLTDIMLGMTADVFMVSYNGFDESRFTAVLLWFSAGVFCVSLLVLPILWGFFLWEMLFGIDERIMTRFPQILGGVSFVVILLLLGNFRSHFFYAVDAENVYHIEIIRILNFVLFYVGLLVLPSIVVKIWREHLWNNIPRDQKISLLWIYLAPSVYSLASVMLFQVNAFWMGITVGLLIVFINSQNSRNVLDPLTGAYNRGKCEQYLFTQVHAIREPRQVFYALIDVNDFKMINDTYGHETGDLALKTVVSVLKEIFHRNGDAVCRYGGDEFVLILPRKAGDDIASDISQAKRLLSETHSETPCPISISVGFVAIMAGMTLSIEDIRKEADKKMYQEKMVYHKMRGTAPR